MKSGVGSYALIAGDGLAIGALAVVNAFGDVVDPDDGTIIAGLRGEKNEFLDTAKLVAGISGELKFGVRNTTLVVVATNATLDKSQAQKVAQMGQVGLAKTVSRATRP